MLKVIYFTVVYARCSAIERLQLWEDLEFLSSQIKQPWIVGGYFNVILKSEEKWGGLPITYEEVADFSQCINNCSLVDLKYFGSDYTWWNGKVGEVCIFKRQDRILGNQDFMNDFPSSEVHHLIRQGSDHAPIQTATLIKKEVLNL